MKNSIHKTGFSLFYPVKFPDFSWFLLPANEVWGNFFTPVCHSVHRGGLCPNMHHRSHDQGGLCPGGLSVQWGSLSGGSLSGGVWASVWGSLSRSISVQGFLAQVHIVFTLTSRFRHSSSWSWSCSTLYCSEIWCRGLSCVKSSCSAILYCCIALWTLFYKSIRNTMQLNTTGLHRDWMVLCIIHRNEIHMEGKPRFTY